MVRVPGAWANFYELEVSLSLPELEAILESAREQEHSMLKFQASLKGINLDGAGASQEERFMDIKNRAAAKAAGKDQQHYELEALGFGVENGGE